MDSRRLALGLLIAVHSLAGAATYMVHPDGSPTESLSQPDNDHLRAAGSRMDLARDL